MEQAEAISRVHALLSASLVLWGAAQVMGPREDADTLTVREPDGSVVLIIGPAPAALKDIFRWSATPRKGAARNSSSVLGLLDTVRDMLGLEPNSLSVRLGVTGTTS
ncbi:hypothetical protein GCM10007276_06390 [Agaricicola taiwanensis]|uniref:Uncharacterized protein n=1 Tax=Agaricicola taiwanensis TaxID=591372 RepID=A0A8J2YFV9_9RHOB|nr:hypothetical protein [Agaricicola taiwanensis]GGE31901.1 hypothetical protein GCM10007276_06390 [Agaricicola taiwanensis]